MSRVGDKHEWQHGHSGYVQGALIFGVVATHLVFAQGATETYFVFTHTVNEGAVDQTEGGRLARVVYATGNYTVWSQGCVLVFQVHLLVPHSTRHLHGDLPFVGSTFTYNARLCSLLYFSKCSFTCSGGNYRELERRDYVGPVTYTRR